MEQEESLPSPQQLQAEAQKEPRRRGLEDYHETIRVLKEEKGFSLREIAAWLRERGLIADHNAVWRAYSKGMHGGSASNISKQSERYEQYRRSDEAMPWLREA
ncbi:MAG TPA: hypothetical protein P5205_12105 [Candidatus Paceibacterota bacterium]|nr:hypothetical protein [Verrucomicrobiota bacterium]HSA11103.1 hypothetical protein [Candidatus Paceibacterota bacterium]